MSSKSYNVASLHAITGTLVGVISLEFTPARSVFRCVGLDCFIPVCCVASLSYGSPFFLAFALLFLFEMLSCQGCGQTRRACIVSLLTTRVFAFQQRINLLTHVFVSCVLGVRNVDESLKAFI